jgi:hypothetical protein
MRVLSLGIALIFVVIIVLNHFDESIKNKDNINKIQNVYDQINYPVSKYSDECSVIEQEVLKKFQWDERDTSEATDSNLKTAIEVIKNVNLLYIKPINFDIGNITEKEKINLIGKHCLFKAKVIKDVCHKNEKYFIDNFNIKGRVNEIYLSNADDKQENFTAILYIYSNHVVRPILKKGFVFSDDALYCGEKTVNGSKVSIFAESAL